MRRWKYIVSIICVALMSAICYAAPAWEHIGGYKATYETEDTDRIEVFVQDGHIYVSTPKSVTVKVMSIVGQLISQQTIPAGVSRLKINSRGIYILKAGTVTTRVTV